MNEKIDILLSRYFSGEASEKELKELDNWLSQSVDNEAYFDDMTILYQQLSFSHNTPDFNTQDALNDFKDYIEKGGKASIRKTFRIRTYINAAAVILVLIGIFSFFFIRQNDPEIIQIAATDIPKEIVLEDRILVSLAPHSEIEYSEKDKNNIHLKGEATFSIESQDKKEFVVQAGETFIKHIGTVFTVSAYEADKMINVEVEEGAVFFYIELNRGIYVHANESATYNPATKEFILHASKEEILELIFNAVPLYEVKNILEEYYDVDIILASPQLENLHITVSFDSNEPIENILEVIAETLSLSVSESEGTFIISNE